ncbi:phosphoadenosine phosphosulfate reductase, partial [Escherichia coli]|nr:phosphoadenosine phosphosulfate reductase [Escherichia coli]MCN8317301.1 phosphoadenosine phosphosulfate reductase [Escherichia coli]MDF0815812.1 phosphoadenosine phosphosulfate reductase [Escherichia coli]
MRRFKFVVQNITAKIVYTRICMGTIQKIRTDVNVLHAAIHRIEWLFETFSSV